MLKHFLIASSVASAILCAMTGAHSAPVLTASRTLSVPAAAPPAVSATTATSGTPLSGDAVFRATGGDSSPFVGYSGHAGVMSSAGVMDMQSVLVASGPPAAGHFVTSTLVAWKRAATYLGAAHKGQSREVGILIEASVRSQRYTTLSLTVGYKSPGISFRNDGLLEWAYESAGLDIVAGDTWSTLSPAVQRAAMTAR
ncbi:MAG: hypothetical protein K8T20_00520 [Planctomycetes bacterium]|nr:hypothetical protein [Planctomycetota bacterium]